MGTKLGLSPLRNIYRVTVFQNKMKSRITGPKGEGIYEDGRKLRNEMLNDG
jgi:hypothetical protein